MKSGLINGIIGGVFLLLIGGLFTKYKFFDDKVELKYLLSEKIESDFTERNNEAIQQLSIKNSGDIIINSIVIKINAEIIDFHIKKFRHTDSVFSSPLKDKIEIIYPELPPEGEIYIIIKSSNLGIGNNQLEIYHSKGKAKEAFSSDKSYGGLFVLLFFSLIYLILSLIGLRNSLIDSYSFKVYYNSYKDILLRKRPIYIPENKWNKLREDSIEYLFVRDYSINVKDSLCYDILNSKKPDLIDDIEWNRIKIKAEEKLIKLVSERLYQYFSFAHADEMMALKKPSNMDSTNWIKIKKEISTRYCTTKLNDILNLFYESSVIEILNSSKPEIVEEKDWDELLKRLKVLYFSMVVEKLITNYSMEDYYKNLNVKILDESVVKRIKSIFEKIQKTLEQEEYNREYYYKLNGVFYWDNIPEKPEKMKTDDWDNIVKIYKEIVEYKQKADEDYKNAIEIKNETLPLKDKVSKQIDLIDRLLKEPETIDKIEDYNIPFEVGNWENLKKVVELLKNK